VLLFQKLCDCSANPYKNFYMIDREIIVKERFDIESYKCKRRSRKSIYQEIQSRKAIALYLKNYDRCSLVSLRAFSYMTRKILVNGNCSLLLCHSRWHEKPSSTKSNFLKVWHLHSLFTSSSNRTGKKTALFR